AGRRLIGTHTGRHAWGSPGAWGVLGWRRAGDVRSRRQSARVGDRIRRVHGELRRVVGLGGFIAAHRTEFVAVTGTLARGEVYGFGGAVVAITGERRVLEFGNGAGVPFVLTGCVD